MSQVPLDVLYRDDYLIAVNKPAGLLVHRSLIDKHETRFAMQMVRDQISQRVYPVHRLDKPTSGILLFALNPEIAKLMTKQFTLSIVQKRYLAVVRGYIDEQGVIDYPLKEMLDKMTDAKANQNRLPQSAISEYQRLATVELPYPVGRYSSARYSLVQIMPKTGRKHQIRRHMKHIFHPIVGDTTHGDGKQNQFFRDQFDCHRLLLAATHLAFEHPVTTAKVALCAQPDAEFFDVIKQLGWHEVYAGALK